MRVGLAFIKWIFVKMFEGLLESHTSFKRNLKRETGIHLVFWFFASVVSSIIFMVVLFVIQYAIGIEIPIQVWVAYNIACVVYLVCTGFSIMYTAFKAERAQLFEIIKQGK